MIWKTAYAAIIILFVGLTFCDVMMEKWLGAALDFFWVTWWISRFVESWYDKAMRNLLDEAARHVG